MLWVPKKGRLRVQHNTGTVGAIGPGTAVTTGAGASTKGAVAQIFASTSFDAYWVVIGCSDYSASATAAAGCIDILTGAATEEILIPNLLMGYAGPLGTAAGFGKVWAFPLYIPAGSRIAAQAAGERLSTAMKVQVYLYGGDGVPPFQVGTKVETYGIGTVPNGVTITAGASGAEGAWTEITASTTRDHFALVPSFQCSADTSTTARAIAVDVGVGAATEEMVGESYWYATDASENMNGALPPMPIFDHIPSGTRLTMRASCSGTTDTYNGAIHGVS